MLARSRLGRDKSYKFKGKTFVIAHDEWTAISNVELFLKLRQYPSVFDTISFFDVKTLLPLSDKITIAKDVISSADKATIRKLKEKPWLKMQARDVTRGIVHFRVLSYNQNILSVYDGVKNIVAVAYRTKGGLGDIIMTTPFLELVGRRFPTYKLIASFPDPYYKMIEENPFVDGVIEYKGNKAYQGDVSIDLSSDCIKHEAETQPDVIKNRPEIFIEKVGLFSDEAPRPKLYLSAGEIENVHLPDKLLIGLVLTTNSKARRWYKVLELRDAIYDSYPDCCVVEISEDKPDWWTPHGKSINMFGKSLREIMAVMSKLDLVISADTGPAHISASLRTKTVWLFTHIEGSVRTKNYDQDLTYVVQTTPDKCPVGKPCWYLLPCIRKQGAKRPYCSDAITVDMVMDKVHKALSTPTTTYCVVYHNKKEMTEECLKRIQAAKKWSDELMLVGNGADFTPFDMGLTDGNIAWINNEKNLGCIEARNQAGKKASGTFLQFFDNDQYISPHTPHRMMQIEADVVGVEAWSMTSDGYAEAINKRRGPLAYIGAGGMLIKKKVFDEVGGFDEAYSPAWFEDPDICFAAREKGYTLGYPIDHGVKHLAHQTNFSQTDYDHKEVWRRNHKIFCAKWDSMLKPDLEFSVILLSLDRVDTTIRCIRSIFENSSLPIEVIVLDQGSSPDDIKRLKELPFFGLQIIESSYNMGCGPGRNKAAEKAIGKYLLFCDDDMIVPPGWDLGISRRFKDTGADGLSPNVIEQKPNGYRYIRFHATVIDNGNIIEIGNRLDPGHPDVLEERNTHVLPGGSLTVKREVFERIRFDERYVFGLEDFDWCLSALEQGMRFVNCPKVSFVHAKPTKNRLVNSQKNAVEVLANSSSLFLSKWGDFLPGLWDRGDFLGLISKSSEFIESSVDEKKRVVSERVSKLDDECTRTQLGYP